MSSVDYVLFLFPSCLLSSRHFYFLSTVSSFYLLHISCQLCLLCIFFLSSVNTDSFRSPCLLSTCFLSLSFWSSLNSVIFCLLLIFCQLCHFLFSSHLLPTVTFHLLSTPSSFFPLRMFCQLSSYSQIACKFKKKKKNSSGTQSTSTLKYQGQLIWSPPR